MFFGAGNTAAVEQTFVERVYWRALGEGSDAWVSVFFIDQMTQDGVSQKNVPDLRHCRAEIPLDELGLIISQHACTHAASFVI